MPRGKKNELGMFLKLFSELQFYSSVIHFKMTIGSVLFYINILLLL